MCNLYCFQDSFYLSFSYSQRQSAVFASHLKNMRDKHASSGKEPPLDVDVWTPNVDAHATSLMRQDAEAAAAKGKPKPYTLLKRRLELARDNVNPALVPAMAKQWGLKTCSSLLHPTDLPRDYHYRWIEARQVCGVTRAIVLLGIHLSILYGDA